MPPQDSMSSSAERQQSINRFEGFFNEELEEQAARATELAKSEQSTVVETGPDLSGTSNMASPSPVEKQVPDSTDDEDDELDPEASIHRPGDAFLGESTLQKLRTGDLVFEDEDDKNPKKTSDAQPDQTAEPVSPDVEEAEFNRQASAAYHDAAPATAEPVTFNSSDIEPGFELPNTPPTPAVDVNQTEEPISMPPPASTEPASPEPATEPEVKGPNSVDDLLLTKNRDLLEQDYGRDSYTTGGGNLLAREIVQKAIEEGEVRGDIDQMPLPRIRELAHEVYVRHRDADFGRTQAEPEAAPSTEPKEQLDPTPGSLSIEPRVITFDELTDKEMDKLRIRYSQENISSPDPLPPFEEWVQKYTAGEGVGGERIEVEFLNDDDPRTIKGDTNGSTTARVDSHNQQQASGGQPRPEGGPDNQNPTPDNPDAGDGGGDNNPPEGTDDAPETPDGEPRRDPRFVRAMEALVDEYGQNPDALQTEIDAIVDGTRVRPGQPVLYMEYVVMDNLNHELTARLMELQRRENDLNDNERGELNRLRTHAHEAFLSFLRDEAIQDTHNQYEFLHRLNRVPRNKDNVRPEPEPAARPRAEERPQRAERRSLEDQLNELQDIPEGPLRQDAIKDIFRQARKEGASAEFYAQLEVYRAGNETVINRARQDAREAQRRQEREASEPIEKMRAELLQYFDAWRIANPKTPLDRADFDGWLRLRRHTEKTDPFVVEAKAMFLLMNLSFAKHRFSGGGSSDFATYITENERVTEQIDRTWGMYYRNGAGNEQIMAILKGHDERGTIMARQENRFYAFVDDEHISTALAAIIRLANDDATLYEPGTSWKKKIASDLSGDFKVEAQLLEAVAMGGVTPYEARVAFILFELTLEAEYSNKHPLNAFAHTRDHAENAKKNGRWKGSLHWWDDDLRGGEKNALPDRLWTPIGQRFDGLAVELTSGRGVRRLRAMIDQTDPDYATHGVNLDLLGRSFEDVAKAAKIHGALTAIGPAKKEVTDMTISLLTDLRDNVDKLAAQDEANTDDFRTETPENQAKRVHERTGYLQKDERIQILEDAALIYFREISVESHTSTQPGAKTLRAVDPYGIWMLWIQLTNQDAGGRSYFDVDYQNVPNGPKVYLLEDEMLIHVRDQALEDVLTLYQNKPVWNAIGKDRQWGDNKIVEVRHGNMKVVNRTTGEVLETPVFPTAPHHMAFPLWEEALAHQGIRGSINNWRPLEQADRELDRQIDDLLRRGGTANRIRAAILKARKSS